MLNLFSKPSNVVVALSVAAIASACAAQPVSDEPVETQEALLVASPADASTPGDLITRVDGFRPITTETFSASSGDVLDACIVPGTHRVMRFDFHSKNIATTDVYLGAPPSDPNAISPIFVWSNSHHHWHIRDFNVFSLTDMADTTIARTGLRQAFCLEDYDPASANPPPAKYNCGNQGVSPGWEDTYSASLPCQFINMDGIPDGVYKFKAKTNASKVAPESNYDNNETTSYLWISGNSVKEINGPCLSCADIGQNVNGNFANGCGATITCGCPAQACRTGWHWSFDSCGCERKCNSPASCCAQAGGYWDGKYCE
jgi:hypothetical protein